MKDMSLAVDLLLGSISRGELIAVYGDYDVDGVTAAALLVKVIGELGAGQGIIFPTGPKRDTASTGRHWRRSEKTVDWWSP